MVGATDSGHMVETVSKAVYVEIPRHSDLNLESKTCILKVSTWYFDWHRVRHVSLTALRYWKTPSFGDAPPKSRAVVSFCSERKNQNCKSNIIFAACKGLSF